MTRTRLAPAWALGAALAVATSGPAADLPPAVQKDITTGVAAYREAVKLADQALLYAIANETELTRKATTLTAEQREGVVQTLTAEKAAFVRDGTIPFSPRMRTATLDYLQRVRAAARPAELAYDQAIEFFAKGKDEASAAEVRGAKRKALAPLVAAWHVELTAKKKTHNWVYHLRADGTADGKTTWTILPDKLVIVNRGDPNGPPGGWVEFCEIAADGQRYTAPRMKAKLIPIPK